MGCKYILYSENGVKHSFTYLELVLHYMDRIYSDKLSALDILFSKSRLEVIYESLLDYKKDYKINNVDYDGIPNYEGKVTLQTFIDSNKFEINGDRPIFLKDDDAYVVEYMENLKELNPDLTDAELQLLAKTNLKHWDIIKDHSILLHLKIGSFNWASGTIDDFIIHCLDTPFALHAGTIFDQIAGNNNNSSNLRLIMFGSNKLVNEKAKLITGLNLTALIEKLDEEIVGHIDNLVIDAHGNLHIYNYKTTSTPTKDWSSVKNEKYKYSMALLKLILAYNGYDVRNITMHLIPILLTYNSDYSAIEDVNIHVRGMEIDIKNGDPYDTAAKHFIKSQLKIDNITSEVENTINKKLKTIFPVKNVIMLGIQQETKEWINDNYGPRWYNKIKKVYGQSHAYELYLEDDRDKVIKIMDERSPEENPEIIEHVQKYLLELNKSLNPEVNKIIKVIESSYTLGKGTFTWNNLKLFLSSGTFLEQTLNPYLQCETLKNGKKRYLWKLLENDTLTKAGILLFLNLDSGQIDVITLTTRDLRVKIPMNGWNNIGGCWVSDKHSNSLINYPANFANIEAARTMVIINEVLPLLKGLDIKLGSLKVISNSGMLETYSFGTLNKEMYQPLLKLTAAHNADFDGTSNFSLTAVFDELSLLIRQYYNLSTSTELPKSDLSDIKSLGFEGLINETNKEAKLAHLYSISRAIEKACPVLQHLDPAGIIKLIKESKNKTNVAYAELYKEVQINIAILNGVRAAHEYRIATWREMMHTLDSVPNKTYRGVTSMFTKAINSLAFKVRDEYNAFLDATVEFLLKSGYTSIRDATIGDLTKFFLNLYKRDASNNILMEFRNPFDDHDTLKPLSAAESEYLKLALFELSKMRCKIYGITFKPKNAHDPEFKKFLSEHPSFLNVPLQKASDSSILQRGIVAKAKDTARKIKSLLNKENMSKAYDEFLNNIAFDEEANQRNEDFKAMSLRNYAIIGDGITPDLKNATTLSRNKMLQLHEPEFFELNLANIMANYTESYVKTEELGKAMVGIKGVLFQLEMLGDSVALGEDAGIELTISMIEDFVKVNVYKESLMEPESQKMLAWLYPFKLLVSKAYIAGNITSAFRDTFEGLWLNMDRTLTHFLTDINGKSVAKAYKEVVLNAFTDPMSVTVIDLLCKIYRLSNLDMSKISESMEIGRGGAFNVNKWLYSTLRGPDFLNRMVLFVARCVLDGSFEAYKMVGNKLVYDWTLDKRYSKYAQMRNLDESKITDEEYWKLKEAYFNAVRQYNKENPDKIIDFSGKGKNALPVAYSNEEIESFKLLANSIYGAYDRAMRAKYENLALGWAFGLFTTWMNGMTNNYFLAPGLYQNRGIECRQETDDMGNLIYLDKDGIVVKEIDSPNGKYYTLEDGTIIDRPDHLLKSMENVPRVVLGIFATLSASLKALHNGGKDEFLATIWADPDEKANLMHLAHNILLGLLFAAFFKLIADPAYKEAKKQMKGLSFLTNMVTEVVYKSTSRSYDGFLGPLNMIVFAGENTNPPIYSLPIKLIEDTGKFVFGDKTFGLLATGNVAVFKWFLDSYKALET